MALPLRHGCGLRVTSNAHHTLKQWLGPVALEIRAGGPLLSRDRHRHLHSSSRTSSQTLAAPSQSRHQGMTTSPTVAHPATSSKSPLSRLSTATLLRSLLLGYCFTSPRLMKVLMAAMGFVVHSKSRLLDPDRNPLVGGVMRAVVYDHFCAGTNPAEVRKTIAQIKSAGYAGVILGYGREIVIEPDGSDAAKALSVGNQKANQDQHIAMWLEGNLETLKMIGKDDYMNVKFTGAGPRVSQCLIDGTQPPEQFTAAIDAICTQAQEQGSRIWIDAEQQIFQPVIDDWTIGLMRKFNVQGDALVFTTIQTYLKSTRRTVARFLKLASAEGWALGIKQVRGAYIASDLRERIWNTKAETDHSYNSVAKDLLSKRTGDEAFPGFEGPFPQLRLFLAGHNKESIRLATAVVRDLTAAGKQIPLVQYGQLQGMADDVSCDLVQQYEQALEGLEAAKAEGKVEAAKRELELQAAPLVYKCLNWGSVKDCLHFLLRRAVENASAAERIKEGLDDLRAELKRRVFRTG